jgi:Cu2+-exporting ATPase
MSCCTDTGSAQLQPDQASRVATNPATEELKARARPLDSGRLELTLVVPQIRCGNCIANIERTLGSLPQVEQIRANLTTRRVNIIWQPANGSLEAVLEKLRELGFDHHPQDSDDKIEVSDKGTTRELLIAVAVAGFAAANIMLLSVSVWSGADAQTAQLFNLIAGLIAVPAVAIAGRPFFRPAFAAIRQRRVNMDVPISLAVLIALASSAYQSLIGGTEIYFDAAMTLLFFLLIGRLLDHTMRTKANNAAQNIAHLVPKIATVISASGELSYLSIDKLTVGLTLLIPRGERIPVNCLLKSPTGEFDRSLVTGESLPASFQAGHQLEAGILNLAAPIEVTVEQTAANSYLAEIQSLMAGAELIRNRYVRIADRMAKIYVPAVHLLAAATAIGWLVASGLDWVASLNHAVAVLIITCPCALGLAAPVVQVIAANRLFQNGILIKDGGGLERLAEIDMVVFDKTGTLTLGKPTISSVAGLIEEHRAIISTLAAHSNHPSSVAIRTFLTGSGQATLTDVEEHPGSGLSATWQGREVRLGKAAWVAEISQDGCNPDAGLAFAAFGRPHAAFNLSDVLRPGAAKTIGRFQRAGLPTTILTGDTPDIAQAIAAQVGIENIHAQLTPQEKVSFIEQQQSAGHRILMVGDGLNDAPALAAAHFSIAPSSGADIGRQAADFIFTTEDLDAVSSAWQTARFSQRLIKQNFALAAVYNLVAIPCAMVGLVTPLIAALAMSGSSLAVVGNSLRLYRTTAKTPKRAVPVTRLGLPSNTEVAT